MTRETKVGVVVSFSFLCLVGTVLFYKFKSSPLPPTMEEVEAEQIVVEGIDEPKPMPSPSGKSSLSSPTVSMPARSSVSEPGQLPISDAHVVPVGAPVIAPTPPVDLDAARTSASAGAVPPAPVLGVGSSGAPLPPPVPPVPPSTVMPAPLSPPSATGATTGLPTPLPGSALPAVTPTPAVTPVPASIAEPSPAPLASGMPATAASSTTGLPSTPEPVRTGLAPAGGLPEASANRDRLPESTPGSTATPGTTAAPSVTMPAGRIDGSSVTPTAPTMSNPPSAPIGGNASHSDPLGAAVPGVSGSRSDAMTPLSPASPSVVPAASGATPGALLGQPIPTPPPPPSPDSGTGLSPGVAAPPMRNLPPLAAADDAPLGSGRSATTGTPPATQVAQATLPTPATGADPVHPLPPVGTQVTAVTPPILTPVPPRPPVSQVPQVDSYDEMSHHCRPGDTLKSLSTQYYNSDKYDQALLLFNREHLMASDSIRQDPPVLQPGQVVFIPQMKILEKRYADKIPGLAPVAPAAPVGSVPAPVGALPQPVTSTSNALALRLYRVRSTGEMVREIAARTLGNAERWAEITQLNRFDPAYPVPPGTILRLPADARVDPADAPPQPQPFGQ